MIIRENTLEKLKDLAYWERVTLKDLVDEILDKSSHPESSNLGMRKEKKF